jgi:uncharacterized repeat protein (TIGR01451 family)
MKKILSILLVLFLNIVAVAQQRFNLHKSSEFFFKTEKKQGQLSSPLSSPFGDTLNQYFKDVSGSTGGLYTYVLDQALPYDTGYIAGTNSFGITATMEKYSLPIGGALKSILFGFGKAVGTGYFNVTVWADSSGVPGSILQTFAVAINQTDTVMHSFNLFPSIQQAYWNCAVNLPSPITFTAGGSFWAGIKATNNPGDTIALLSTLNGLTINPSHQNEVGFKYTGNVFYTYNAGFATDILFCIFPVIGYPPCAINGNVYNDVNSNNIKDAGDTSIANVKVSAGNYIGFTNANGDYTVYVDSGSYSVSANVQYATEFPININASVPTSGSISNGNDFAAHYIPGIRDVSVKLIGGPFRPGFGGDYYLNVQNNGTQTDSGSVTLIMDDSLQYSWSVPTATVSGNVVNFNYPPIAPGQNSLLYVGTYISSSVGINYPLKSSVSITPLVNDSNPTNNYDTSVVITTGSYDPNEKTVSPSGNISPAFVSAGNYLYYTIQFQNTGTDTAINIKVIDTLSSMLDVTSFDVTSASHSYTVSIKNNYIITFSFNHIMLLDSGRSEPKSHGFISYKIKPKNGLALGSTIKNTAYIYFDFNPAVVTNTALTTVSNANVSVESIGNNISVFSAFPNPFTQEINLMFKERGNYDFKVVDLLGRVKHSGSAKNAVSSTVDLSVCSPGAYLIIVEGNKGVQQAKIIKQ